MGLTMAGATALGASIQGGASLIGLPLQGYLQKKSEERQQGYNEKNMAIQQGYARENAEDAHLRTMQLMNKAQGYNEKNAKLQQQLNEESAINAHNRNLQMYEQTQSTRAKMAELEKAGLSIGLLQGTPSQGGASSGGTANTSVSGMSAPSGAMAQTGPMGVTQAQTLNIMDTINSLGGAMANIAKSIGETKVLKQQEKIEEFRKMLTEFEKDIKEVEWKDKRIEQAIKFVTWKDNDGKPYSLTELAREYNNFGDFLKNIEWNENDENAKLAQSEYGKTILHQLYLDAKSIDNQILAINFNEKNLQFQEDIMKAMKNQDFAEMSAKSQRKFLEANIATNELTATQKDAWNKMLDKIENEDIKNGLIVLAMLVNQMAGSWHMPNMSTYNTNNYVTNQ